MATTPLAQWARARWVSMALAVAWLLDNDVAGSAQQTADLLELGRMLHSQGTDWNRWFDSNFTECMTGDGTKQTGQHCAAQRRICPSVLGCSSSDDAPLQLGRRTQCQRRARDQGQRRVVPVRWQSQPPEPLLARHDGKPRRRFRPADGHVQRRCLQRCFLLLLLGCCVLTHRWRCAFRRDSAGPADAKPVERHRDLWCGRGDVFVHDARGGRGRRGLLRQG